MGHVHGWTVGAPALEKESQKAKQRVASTMEGIYDDVLSGFFHAFTKPPGNILQNTLADQDEF